MEYTWLFWLIAILDKLQAFFAVSGGICVALAAITLFLCFMDSKPITNRAWLATIALFGTLLIFIGCLLPSKDDAVKILAATAVVEAAKTETAQRLAASSVELIEQWVKELTPNKAAANK